MSSHLTYSVLQYKHSLVLGESLNVGILFYFHEEDFLVFVSGDGTRAKAIYPDFDNTLYNAYLKAIIAKVNLKVDLFNQEYIGSDFAKYIHNFILPEDAAGLVFSEPRFVKNESGDRSKAVDEYSKLLLPGINIVKPTIIKHNENYIIKQFNGYLFAKDKSLESRFIKDEIIQTKHFKIKFDLAWQKSSRNFIKTINFDFTDEVSLQNKAAISFCHLNDLDEYASTYNSRFDLLISKPQNSSLYSAYENALDFLESVKTPKKLITEDHLKEYSLNLISELTSN
jgi:hypothetical protein